MGINLRMNKGAITSANGKYYPEVDVQKTLKACNNHNITHNNDDVGDERLAI
jgi:hypothetical protein